MAHIWPTLRWRSPAAAAHVPLSAAERPPGHGAWALAMTSDFPKYAILRYYWLDHVKGACSP